MWRLRLIWFAIRRPRALLEAFDGLKDWHNVMMADAYGCTCYPDDQCPLCRCEQALRGLGGYGETWP